MRKDQERSPLLRSLVIGSFLTLVVLIADDLGLLRTLEHWLDDQRTAHCQVIDPPPTNRITYLDIDDASLDALGRWPWPRSTLVRILNEVQRAQPAAMCLDILLAEPQPPRLVKDPQGNLHTIDDDQELAKVFLANGKVVLAASFNVESNEAQSPQQVQAVGWYNENLELPDEEFRERARQAGWQLKPADENDLLIRARRAAIKDRISDELDKGPATVESLIPRLLPHTDPNEDTLLVRLVTKEYADVAAEHAIYRFGSPMQPMAMAPARGALQVVPERVFTDGAASCAFANFDIFDDSTVRSVPLFVESKGRLYPQLGLAMACTMLGADPTKARFDGSNVIIPATGNPIRIPTYPYHSRKLDRDVAMIADIPWFGGSDWMTMYDWPAHRLQAAHLSIANVWDICFKEDQIAKNSASIDEAISQILDNDRPDKLGLDPDAAHKYTVALPDPHDTASREKTAQAALKILHDSQWLDAFQRIPENELTDVDRFQRDKLLDAVKVLHDAVAESRQLRADVDADRSFLVTQVKGKGVIVGFTAEGTYDRVTTSIHLHCPGVIVHGVIANAVLTGRWWHASPSWIAIVLTALFGLATARSESKYSPLVASLMALAVLAAYGIFNAYVLFGCFRVLLGMAGPMLVIVVVWAGCTLDRLVVERVERGRIAVEMAAVSREMDLAHQVQTALIPKSAPSVSGIEADGWTLPASVTGGDCYDLWQLPDGRLAILLADASGHGLAPAMIVSQVRTLVAPSESETHPQALLNRVNNRIANDLEASRFVTAFLGFLSNDGTLHWASAGHGPIYWLHNSEGEVLELASTGLPLGIQEDCFLEDPLLPVQLSITGSLIVFSDGLFEAPAPDGPQFGVERFQKILRENCGQPSATIIAALRSAVQKWQGKITPVDDQTIVVVRRIAPPA